MHRNALVTLAFCLPASLLAAPTLPADSPYPMITTPARLADRHVARRDLLDSLTESITKAQNDFTSVLGSITGSSVLSSLGLSNADLDATPTSVLNIPGYGNWTEQGWNLRFRGNVYKHPNISEEKLNDLADVFLVNTDIESLPPAQQTQARNLTSEIFVVQQSHVNVTFQLSPAPAEGGDATAPATAAENLALDGETTAEGDYDSFQIIPNDFGLTNGNETQDVQRLQERVNGTDSGNATGWLVPPTNGLIVISDIDDILRVTQIYQPAQGILNTFAKAFVPWMNMPSIYNAWKSIPGIHFHYLTTTPEQGTRLYEEFIFNNYPAGSFDTRPLNFSDVNATLHIREYLLVKIFQTFPTRQFVLVADTSNADVMKDYPAMAKQYPNNVKCIFLRNTSATDSEDHFPYDTSGFKDLNQNQYMFFRVPDDLTGLDISNGQCLNSTIPQNVTFSEQGLPLGLSKKKSAASRITGTASGWLMGVAIAAVMACAS